MLTRKLQFGPLRPNWESKRSEHAHVSASKCNWGGLRRGALSPSSPSGVVMGPRKNFLRPKTASGLV